MDKPDGFDFRDRRSDKTGDSHDWTGHDALYSARQGMPVDAKAAVIVWMNPDGTFQYRKAGGAEWGALLATKFLQHGI